MTGMMQSRVRCIDASQSGLTNFETEIDVRMRDRRILCIEPAETKEIGAPNGEAGRRQGSHVTQRLRKIEMLRGICCALMECRSRQPAHSQDKARVLDVSGL